MFGNLFERKSKRIGSRRKHDRRGDTGGTLSERFGGRVSRDENVGPFSARVEMLESRAMLAAYNMSNGNSTWDFADIANWSNNFAFGQSVTGWESVGIIGTGTDTTAGTRTTKSSATFVTGASGGLQKGTQALQFLSTGSGSTPEAVAVDLALNFTGRNAGTLTFDWAAIDNASGTRPASMRVFTSTDGTSFTELVGARLLDKESSTSPASGTISTLDLPSSFSGSATARIRFYEFAGAATGSGNRDKIQIDNVAVTSTAAATPTITGAATATAFSTTYGTASAAQSFNISGSGLSANITATAPTGFQVSSDGTNYGSTATFTQSSGSASGTLRVRLAATAVPGGTYNSQNITLTSTGATTVNIATASSGNSVSQKALTITGLTAADKVYDASTTASVTGTAALSGINGSDTVTLGGTGSYAFANKNVGTSKSITTTGYTLGGANSSYYTLTQPSFSANITAKALTITGAAATNRVYDRTTTIAITGGSLSGVITNDTVTLGGSATGSVVSAGVGTTKSVTVSGYSISGTDSGNYSLSQPTGLTADITTKALTITGLTAQNKNFDGTTAASVTGTPAYSGLAGSDSFSVTGTVSWAFANSTVGTNKSLVRTGSYDTPSSNYTVTQPTLSATVLPSPSPSATATGSTPPSSSEERSRENTAWVC